MEAALVVPIFVKDLFDKENDGPIFVWYHQGFPPIHIYGGDLCNIDHTSNIYRRDYCLQIRKNNVLCRYVLSTILYFL